MNNLTLTAVDQPCMSAEVDYQSVGDYPPNLVQNTIPTRAIVAGYLGRDVAAEGAVVDRSSTSNGWHWQPRLWANRVWTYAQSDSYRGATSGTFDRVGYYWTMAGSADDSARTAAQVRILENGCSSDSAAQKARMDSVRRLLAAVQLRTSPCVDAAAFQALNGSKLENVNAAYAVCLPVQSRPAPVALGQVTVNASAGSIRHTASDGDWYMTVTAAHGGGCGGDNVDHGYTSYQANGQTWYCHLFAAHGYMAFISISHGTDNGSNQADDETLIGLLRMSIAARP